MNDLQIGLEAEKAEKKDLTPSFPTASPLTFSVDADSSAFRLLMFIIRSWMVCPSVSVRVEGRTVSTPRRNVLWKRTHSASDSAAEINAMLERRYGGELRLER